MKFNKYFDHTNLKPEATKDDIRTYVKKQKSMILHQYVLMEYIQHLQRNVFPEVMLRHVLLLDFR